MASPFVLNMEQWMRDVSRRLRALEAQARLRRTSVDVPASTGEGAAGFTGEFTAVRRGTRVTLDGVLGAVPDPPGGVEVAILPPKYRPSTPCKFLVMASTTTNGAVRLISIATTGVITLVASGVFSQDDGFTPGAAGTGIYLNGVGFEAA